jgi:hypothetical protein
MLIELDVHMIIDQHEVLLFAWVPILFHGVLKNMPLFLGQAQRQNTRR